MRASQSNGRGGRFLIAAKATLVAGGFGSRVRIGGRCRRHGAPPGHYLPFTVLEMTAQKRPHAA